MFNTGFLTLRQEFSVLNKLHRIIRQNDHRSKHDEMDARPRLIDQPDDTDNQCGLCWPFQHDEDHHPKREEEQ
jgi:hypothetical protein